MLSKPLCIQCHNRAHKHDPHKRKWDNFDVLRWNTKGKVRCYALPFQSDYGKAKKHYHHAKVTYPPPLECPWILEHLMKGVSQ